MILKKLYFALAICTILYSCADYQIPNEKSKKQKNYFFSSGFALIYNENLFENKIINKKMKNDNIYVMHNLLKTNTRVKITNPINSKFIDTKIYKKAEYPEIFNIIITEKLASILELDLNNPYVEVTEIKKNKTFVASKSNTFDEEKNVADKAPVDEVKMDDLTKNSDTDTKPTFKNENFNIRINDFYYESSAVNLKNTLFDKTKFNNIIVKKINNNKYRVIVGPFKNFNALKTAYISLNNLGFENLNIYNE
jgi:hypothetical protein